MDERALEKLVIEKVGRGIKNPNWVKDYYGGIFKLKFKDRFDSKNVYQVKNGQREYIDNVIVYSKEGKNVSMAVTNGEGTSNYVFSFRSDINKFANEIAKTLIWNLNRYYIK